MARFLRIVQWQIRAQLARTASRLILHQWRDDGMNLVKLRERVPWAEIPDDCVVRDFAVLGRLPVRSAALAREIPEVPLRLVIGRRVDIGSHAVIYADVEIGEDTLIGDQANVREGCRIGKRCIIGQGVSLHYGVQIGDDVKIMNGTHITGGMRIGNGCFIGVGVVTSNDRRVNMAEYRFHGIQPPVLGERVMVGSGANILAGVKIGDGAVIAAGALVVKDVPAGVTMLGPPAQRVA